MTVHDVKVQPRWFERIRLNEKTAEVRWAGDRDYQAGDEIRFARTDDELGKAHGFQTRVITHVLDSAFVEGLTEGWVVLSLRDPRVENLQLRLGHMVEVSQTLQRGNSVLRGQNRRLREAAKS